MKTKFFSAVLIVMCLALANLDVFAQKYAKVTVYTNSQQSVSGTLKRYNIDEGKYDWSGNFSFYANEGQTVDEGYMYQKWVLLSNWGWPDPVGYNYYLEEFTYTKSCRTEDTWSPQTWPTYVILPGLDFRSQGGQ